MTRVIRSLLRVFLPILATSIAIVNATDFAEWTPAPDDTNIPTAGFDEKELWRLIDQPINKTSPIMLEDGTASPYHFDEKSPAILEGRDPDPYPNGMCPPHPHLYVHTAEDLLCDQKYDGGDGTISYASHSSVCGRVLRYINCKLCFGYGVRNPHAELPAYIFCGRGKLCAQTEPRWNKWGVISPTTTCVRANTITEKIIAAGYSIKEYCSIKVHYSSAGKSRVAGFHARFFNIATGLYVKAKWLHLKVNGFNVGAARNSPKLDTEYTITSTSVIEMCAFPLDTKQDHKLQFQVYFT